MTLEALSLDCRLLCASVVTYGINSIGQLTPLNPYYSSARFLAPPAVFVAGDDDIDACLVGTTEQDILVAFRGTIPPNIHNQQSMLDWIGDLTDEPIAVPGIAGKVHEGFWQGLAALWEPLLKEVQKQTAATGLPLHITGHSKGGALASLAALRLKQETGIAPASVITYASPHPGDSDFAKQYNLEIPYHSRYEYGNDIVPHVVPDAAFIDAVACLPELGKFCKGMETWDYSAVGSLQFIDWNQKHIVKASSELHIERLIRLVGAIAEGKFEEIIGAHSASSGGGYMGGICSSSCAGG
jgi:Lipase (class 3)